MYALKARDRMHKREKDARKEREKDERRRSREQEVSPQGGGGAGQPYSSRRHCKYIGSFSVQQTSSWRADISKTVRKHLSKINVKRVTSSVPVVMVVSVEGVKVISSDENKLIMAHALQRVVFSTADTKKNLFALVARNPQTGPESVFCHIFHLPSREAASNLSELVGKAFKSAFARQSLERDRPQGPSPSGGNWSQGPSPPGGNWSQGPSPPGGNWSQGPNPPGWTGVVYPSQNSSQPPNAMTAIQSSTPAMPWTVVQEQGAPTAPPWSVGGGASGQGGGASGQAVQGPNGGVLNTPLPGPTPSPTPQQEVGQLEAELVQLHSRIQELEAQLAAVGEDEGAALQVTIALSSCELQVEEKRRRLAALQPSIASTGPTSSGRGRTEPSPVARTSVPDISSLSLEDAEWFQAGLPREIVMEVLSQQGEGAFLVRESASSPGSHALSLKGPQGKIVHFLIQTSPNGVNLQGSQLVFPDLVSLIMHHCSQQENLPCPLSLSTSNPTFLDGDTPASPEADADSDYLEVASYRLLQDS